MATTLKIVVLIGGLVGVGAGLAMLLFIDKFMVFNDYVNKNILIGKRYELPVFGVDRWLFGKSFILAIILTVVGIGLLVQFIRYAPY